MDGKLSSEQAKILKAIKDGDLGKEDIEKGLLAIIDAEMSQNNRSANMELVNACCDLLHRINYSDATRVSNKTKSLANAQKKLVKRKIQRRVLRQAIRIAAAVLIVIGGGICSDLIISRETLIATPTIDEQQYEVTGSVVEGTFISDVQADSAGHYSIIGTSEMDAVADTLGYVPDIPTWLPAGWEPADYYATTSDHGSSFRMKYQNNTKEKYIKYSINRYSDIDNAQIIFEQSKSGDACLITDHEVYIANNLDSKVAVWISGTTCYSISGPITTDELVSIIKSITRSENHNAQ